METTLRQILEELQHIRHELQEVKTSLRSDREIIEAMLQRRGITAIKYTPHEHIVLPAHCSKTTEDEFYHLMTHYSFRIFLRDVIIHHYHLKPEHLSKYCSPEVADDYLTTLVEAGILHQVATQQYRFHAGTVPSFGDTLEWFVAAVMRREFGCPAAWGLRLKDTETGGDYDVITAVEGYLAYIEVKSSPPRHIEQSEVGGFLDRFESLRPDFAIFLEDTHLRMKDKLAGMFTEEMQRRYGAQAQIEYPVRRLHDEIFTINTIIFIANTKPALLSNLGICLKHFLARGLG